MPVIRYASRQLRSLPPMMKHLILLTAVAVLVLGACTAPAEQPDPLERYFPAFDLETLSADFDADALPRYDIKLKIDPETHTVEGTARIRFRNISGRPLNDLYVRLYPNLPQLTGEMRLTGSVTLPDRFATGMGWVVEGTAARITLTEPLPPNEILDLELNYVITTAERDGYVLFGESEGILSLPYSYPLLAAQTGDPSNPWRLEIPPPHGDIAITNSAFYAITATVPSDVTLVSTGVEIATAETIPGWTDHIIVTGPVREWGMIMSENFEVESLEIDGVRVNSYYLPEDAIAGRAALDQAASVLRVYDRILAPYPYKELDIVQAPTRYLGMEFPGLNYIGLDTYRGQDHSQEWLVAHEISHQWWYALVGSDPYRYPWLDEGLAEQSSLMYWETLYGTKAANSIRKLRWEIPTQWAIDNGYDDLVGQEVTAFNGANYEILVYAKSARFFDALYKELGSEKYLQVLQTYIDRYQFETPTPDDFLAVVREVGGFDPQALYQQWILSAEGNRKPDSEN